MPDMSDKLLTTEQVAEIFGVTKRTIDRWYKVGFIHRANTPGHIARYTRSEVERYMKTIPMLSAEQPEA